MADKKHFVLDGLDFRAAEDAEGSHYRKTAEPVRPPNAVTVQGENNQRFQIRPDVLLWSVTDWAGGQGQVKFNPQSANRHWEIRGRAFDSPGQFSPVVSADVITTAAEGLLFAARNTLYGFSTSTATMFTWSGTDWDAGTALTSGGAAIAIDNDESKVYLLTSGGVRSANIGATTFSLLNAATSPHSLRVNGDYLYLSPASGDFAVREIDKTTGDTEDIAYHTIESNFAEIVPMDGKVYSVASVDYKGTEVLEIIPTSAAGTGYGYPITLIAGFEATCAWEHGGILFLGGHDADDDTKLSIMYVQPGGAYGTLGSISTEKNQSKGAVPFAKGKMNRWLSHYFMVAPNESHDEAALYEIDSVSGGMAQVAYGSASHDIGAAGPFDAIFFQGRMFASVPQAVGDPITLVYDFDEAGGQTGRSYFITPWQDFGLSGEKILSSLVLDSEDPMPTNWSIVASVYFDGDTDTAAFTGTWSAGSGLDPLPVSTSVATRTFKSMRLELEIRNGTADGRTTWPTINGVDVFVQINRPVRRWTLLLDLSDDLTRRHGFSGADRIQKLETLIASKEVFKFTDYYLSHTRGQTAEEADVILDACTMVLSQPGEGVAEVTLVEVV